MANKQLVSKRIGVPLMHKSMQKDENEREYLLVTGKFTSDQRDEVGDTITREATLRAVPKYKEWGNIRYMHQPRPVAVVNRISEGDGLQWNEVEIKVYNKEAIFEVEVGLLKALSVGILINMEDVEVEGDGGWKIHDYSLAEISLVDHPANYDAKLDIKNLGSDFVNLARQEGIYTAVKQFKVDEDVTEEITMDEEQELVEEEVIEENKDIVEEEVEEIVEETKELIEEEKEVPVEEEEEEEEVEEEEEELERGMVEEIVTDELVVEDEPVVEKELDEEVVEEETIEIEDEEEIVLEEEVELEVQELSLEPSTPDLTETLVAAITDLQTTVKALAEAFYAEKQTTSEPVEEVQEEVVEELVEEDKGVEEIELLKKEIASLREELDALRAPANRKGKVLPVEVEEPAEEVEEKAIVKEKPLNLREAVKLHVESRFPKR